MPEPEEIVDAVLVPESEPAPEPVAPVVQPSNEVVRYNSGSTELVPGATAADRVAAARDIATALHDVIASQGLRTKVGTKKKLDPRTGDAVKDAQGRDVYEPRWHVDIEGWQTLATLLGCAIIPRPPVAVTDPTTGAPLLRSFEVTEKSYYKKAEGSGLKSTRTWTVEGHDWQVTVDIVKDGALIASGTGLCSRTETKWNSSDEFAVQSMAATRGASRAVANCARWIVALAGYSTTPSEEMPYGAGTEAPTQAGPEFGPPLDAASIPRVHAAIKYLLGYDIPFLPEPDSEPIYEAIAVDAGGYFPRSAGRAILRIASGLKARMEAPTEPPAPAADDPGGALDQDEARAAA